MNNLKIGSKVKFQFDDGGVVRYAEGELVGKDGVGMYICQFEHSGCTAVCLPAAVWPIGFNKEGLMDKIATYGRARSNHRDVEGVKAITKSHLEDSVKNLCDYIGWIE